MSNGDPKPPINVDYFEDLTGKIEPGKPETGGAAPCDQIGRRIQKIREQKGISISDLSQLTGFDKQMLQDIEKGDVCPQLGTVIKLSKALDSALERLIGDEGRKLYAVTRRDERKVIARTTTSHGHRPAYTYMSLAPEVKGRHMEACEQKQTGLIWAPVFHRKGTSSGACTSPASGHSICAKKT